MKSATRKEYLLVIYNILGTDISSSSSYLEVSETDTVPLVALTHVLDGRFNFFGLPHRDTRSISDISIKFSLTTLPKILVSSLTGRFAGVSGAVLPSICYASKFDPLSSFGTKNSTSRSFPGLLFLCTH